MCEERTGEGEGERDGNDARLTLVFGDERMDAETERNSGRVGVRRLVEDARVWAGRVSDRESVCDLLELSGVAVWIVDSN